MLPQVIVTTIYLIIGFKTRMLELCVSRSVSTLGRRIALRHLSTSTAKYKIFDVADEKEFQKEVLSAKKPVVVDFHAR